MDTNVATTAPAAEIENVEVLLGDLEVGTDESGAVIEDITLDAATESAVEAAMATADAYEEQTVTTTSVEAPAATTEATKTKKAKAPKEPKAPKVPRDLNSFALDVFGVADDAAKTALIAARPTQKKIAEKFDNLFQSINAIRKPSTYTVVCFNALVAGGTVTQTDLVAALKATASDKAKTGTYDEGTARSQAGQMMALFAVVGIASREKQTLTLNASSPLVAKLKALCS